MIYICIPTTEERKDRLVKCVESLHKNAGEKFVIATYQNKKEGFIGPIQNILSGLKDDTLVWCIGDDSVINQKDTLKLLKERFLKEYPEMDGVVQPDDGIQHGDIITMPFCTAKTMRDYTFKGYFLNFADNEFTEIMRDEMGKYTYCPEIKVDHEHWCNGKAEKDETYKHASSLFVQDRDLYNKRKANNFHPRNNEI